VKQWEYIQSLEQKVMEAITNIGEVQLMLNKRLPKLGSIDEKEVLVEAASKRRNCGLGKDAKYYTGTCCSVAFIARYYENATLRLRQLSDCLIATTCLKTLRHRIVAFS
jgi:hypothetical protein